MKKKKLKARAFRYWCNMLAATGQRIQAEEENTKLHADIEQLQADFCAEVTELNELIELQRQMLATAQDRISDLMKQNTRLLARGGEWQPVNAIDDIPCYCHDDCATFMEVSEDGKNITVCKDGETISYILPDNMRLCAK